MNCNKCGTWMKVDYKEFSFMGGFFLGRPGKWDKKRYTNRFTCPECGKTCEEYLEYKGGLFADWGKRTLWF